MRGNPSTRTPRQGGPRRGVHGRKKTAMALDDDDIDTTPGSGEGTADGGSNPEGHDGGADGTASGEGTADGGSNPEGHDGGADGTA
nr:hypothetical protein Mflv_0336 [Mycolicibacterium gilvum PYR-GCK]